jgi:enoyl-CoA hydratase/carnithine racemase
VRPRAWEVRTPGIGAIRGAAIGIGCSLSLRMGMRIVAQDALLAEGPGRLALSRLSATTFA